VAGKYIFLPNLRTAVAARASAPQAGARREVRIGVRVLANGVAHGEAQDVVGELLGAGDIVSLHPSMVARVEPESAARAVEPNYFPYVEFVDADFPWRYSLDVGASHRLRPWLLLVALEAREFRYLGGGGVLPRIEVFDPKTSLPNPDQSWAFAHVHVSQTDPAASLDQTLRASPDASHARLLCPRRLHDNTPYHLFLVPTFEAGRLAGISAGGSAQPWNAVAWDVAANGPVELPVYREWTFRTSTLEDFESLVRRLQPVPAESGSPFGGTRTVFSGRPGYYDDLDDPTLTFEAEGALHHVDFERDPPLIEHTALTPRLETTLTAVIESDLPEADSDGPEQEDPLVALPVYGRHFARPEVIAADTTSTPWVHEVNLDPRLRLAAGVGARIVKRHQEPFMEKCWQQLGEIQSANRLRARLQLLTRINEVLADKHLSPLSSSVAGEIAAPFLHAVKTPFGGNRTMRADLRVRGVPRGEASPLVRRLAAKRPDIDIARRASSPGGTAHTPPPAGLVRTLSGLAAPSASELQRATRRVQAMRAAVADASDVAQLIPAALAAVHTISFDRPSFEAGPIETAHVVNTVVSRLHELPVRKATDLISGTASAEEATLEPIVRAPRLPIPLAGYVEEEDASHLLPNVGELPDNSIAIVMENRAFIEALMAGANHEMNRELRWREFPTDMRASVFSRFWSSGHAPDDTGADDLRPLDLWDGHVGQHFRRGDRPSLTVVIHGDLVRRYPDLVVAVNRQVIPQGGKWDAGRGPTTYPVFTGVIGGSTGFYGFDLPVDDVRSDLETYYFVLYEPADRFRFGLDIATYGKRTSRHDLGRAPMPFPLATMVASRRAVRIRGVQDFWKVPPEPVESQPKNPDDLSWEHVTLDAARYIDFDRRVQFTEGPDLLGLTSTSASIARATLQRPISAVVPAKRMLSDA
jgi:hypothetical protein